MEITLFCASSSRGPIICVIGEPQEDKACSKGVKFDAAKVALSTQVINDTMRKSIVDIPAGNRVKYDGSVLSPVGFV